MPKKFQNKYRIESTRMQNWDYGWNAAYFITICTKDKECYFGNIAEGIMQLSEIGKTVESEWLKTIEIRPDMNLELGEYIVMPNHFHAVIIIGNNKFNTPHIPNNGTNHDNGDGRDAMHRVSTSSSSSPSSPSSSSVHKSTSDKPNPSIESNKNNVGYKNSFAPQSKNLASIIRGFKSSVTINARKTNIDFSWQARYHDHIIRNNNSFVRISDYIINNPSVWKDDRFFK